VAKLGSRIASVHVHDNHAVKDEHLWPGDGNIAWPETAKAIKALAPAPAVVLEIGQSFGADPAEVCARAPQAFALLN